MWRRGETHIRPSARPTSRAPGLLKLLTFLWIASVATGAADDDGDASAESLEAENEELKSRLKALQDQLKEEEQYSVRRLPFRPRIACVLLISMSKAGSSWSCSLHISPSCWWTMMMRRSSLTPPHPLPLPQYVVTRGYIAGAENVYMETMEVASAKQWCNSNPNCFGFTFLGGADGEQQPDDEVTVTFKGAPAPGTTNLDVEPDQAYVSYVKHTSSASILGHVGDAGMQLDGGSAALVGHWIGFNSAALVFVLGLAGVVACRHRRRPGRPPQPPLLPGP